MRRRARDLSAGQGRLGSAWCHECEPRGSRPPHRAKRTCNGAQERDGEEKEAMTIDIVPLRKNLGRKIEDEDVVTEAPLKAMIATFDRPDKAPGPGEPIAPG